MDRRSLKLRFDKTPFARWAHKKETNMHIEPGIIDPLRVTASNAAALAVVATQLPALVARRSTSSRPALRPSSSPSSCSPGISPSARPNCI